MKFLCLCHYDLDKYNARTPEDFERIKALCEPRDRQLRASGHLVCVGSLGLPGAYQVIRGTPAGPVVEPGAYAPTNEPSGAFFILDCASMEEAIELAKIHPGAHLAEEFGGGIEVRPIDYFLAP
jgi:hypothetical protein